MKIDFGLTAKDYAKHRAGFPDSIYEHLAAFQVGGQGQLILDLGTGTGTLARGFAARSCRVIGLDPAIAMLEQANEQSRADQVGGSYLAAKAEAVPFMPGCIDVVTAGQCWHWFDRALAASEALRVLRPGGAMVIAHFDWIPLKGNVVELTEQLIVGHNPRWKFGGGMGIHPRALSDLGEAGFENLRTFSYDTFAMYTHEGWRGRIRASAGIGASLPEVEVRAFDAALAVMLIEKFPDPMPVHHRVWAVIAEKSMNSK